MKRRLMISAPLAAALGSALLAGNALAQSATKQQLAGTWKYVLATATRPDGSRFYPQGENSTGLLMLDAAGNFSWQVIRPDIPQMASNNRLVGTEDEYKAMAQGVLSYFGTYTVDESGGQMTMQIVSSSFPNFNGVAQKRSITLSGDDLTIVNPGGSVGGTAEVKWSRMK